MRSITHFYLFHYGMIITSILFIRSNGIAALSGSDKDTHHEIDLCLNQDYFRCPEGSVISVLGVQSGGDDDTHAHRAGGMTDLSKTVSLICNGHQTCSDIGLAGMMATQCAKQSVTCRFQCVPGETALCRSNVCAMESHGLSCPPKTTIHIREVSCSYGDRACQWDNYVMMASLCEGSARCEASGLRALLSHHCQNKQVFVDYVCVPAKMVHNPCSKNRYRQTIGGDFGVIRQPNKNRKSICRWKISSTDKTPVHFNVQLLTQLNALKVRCDPNHLKVKYNDCRKPNNSTSYVRFCDSDVSSTHLDFLSCGPDILMGVGTSHDFIISYHKFSNSKPEGFLSSGLPACLAPPPPTTDPSVLTMPSQSQPANVSQKALHDPGPTDLVTEESSHSGLFRITLKMLLVYIFLGALILILLAALITVLVRYYRISLPKTKYADSSENVTLWKRYDDTALDVFQNSMAEPVDPVTPQTVHRSDRVAATIHHEPPPEREDLDNRISVGSGFSSFLPPKRDSGFKDFLDSFQLNSFASYNNTNGSAKNSTPNGNAANGNPRSVSKYDYYELPEHRTNTNTNTHQDLYESAEVDDEDDDDCDPFGGHYSHPNSLSRPPKPLSPYRDGGYQHDMAVIEDHQPLVTTPNIRPKDNYHYCVNDDEYAVVVKPHKTVAANGGRYPPNHNQQQQQQLNNQHHPHPHRQQQQQQQQQQQINQNHQLHHQHHPNQQHHPPGGRIHPNQQNGVDGARRSVDFHYPSGSFDKPNHAYNYNNHGPPPTNSGYRKSREATWRDEV